MGAKHVGIIQRLPSTCRLHQVDPYTCLVDALQRIDLHPAREVEELRLLQTLALNRTPDKPSKSASWVHNVAS